LGWFFLGIIVSTLSLVAGTLLMLWHRRWVLLGFLAPIAICQLLVAIAGYMRGDLNYGMPAPLFFAFCAVQLLIIVYLVYVAKGTRLAALLLAVFCVAYSLMAAFIATMSFSDTFL
jgi:hypothetical protein